jgi:hypothetical protein
MDEQSSRRLVTIRCCLALAGAALLGGVPAASARVTTLTINNTQSAFGGASFGSVGTYEVITGTFTDEVDLRSAAEGPAWRGEGSGGFRESNPAVATVSSWWPLRPAPMNRAITAAATSMMPEVMKAAKKCAEGDP